MEASGGTRPGPGQSGEATWKKVHLKGTIVVGSEGRKRKSFHATGNHEQLHLAGPESTAEG